MNKLLVGLMVAMAFTPLMAADFPTKGDTDREMARINAKGRMPGEKNIQIEQGKVEAKRKEVFAAPAEDFKRHDFSQVEATASNIDIQALAKRYENKVMGQKKSDLFVFVSFGMPKESLKRTLVHANKVGATLVFRGFKNNSWKETNLAIAALGEHTGNVVINPDAFAKYKVEAVPTVVLLNAENTSSVDEDGCALPENFAAVPGDVGLDYSLKFIAENSTEFKEAAETYARALMGEL